MDRCESSRPFLFEAAAGGCGEMRRRRACNIPHTSSLHPKTKHTKPLCNYLPSLLLMYAGVRVPGSVTLWVALGSRTRPNPAPPSSSPPAPPDACSSPPSPRSPQPSERGTGRSRGDMVAGWHVVQSHKQSRQAPRPCAFVTKLLRTAASRLIIQMCPTLRTSASTTFMQESVAVCGLPSCM